MTVIAHKYKEIILYLFFGGCTTLINLLVYYLCYEQICISNVASTAIAWASAVAFAFVTNKLWVFDSKSLTLKLVLWEGILFVLCRLLTGLLDVAIMYISVDILALSPLLWKIIANVIVIISNWTASKLYIFKKEENKVEKP